MQQQQRGGTWRRLGRIWLPVLLQLLISYLVSMVFSMIFMFSYVVAETGNDAAVMMSMFEDEAAVEEMYTAIADAGTQYTTQMEGVAALITIPVMLILFHRDRLREKAACVAQNLKAPLSRYVFVIVIAAALAIGVNNLLLISGLSVNDEAYVETMEAMYSPPLYLQILCVGILSPIAEELVYRGLIYRRIRESSTFLASAIYGTLIFAILHGYLPQMIYAFALGFVFCYIYEKYGSIRAPIAAHMTANILSILITYFSLDTWMMEAPVRIAVVTILCAAVASTMYLFIQRIEEKPPLPANPEGKENLTES